MIHNEQARNNYPDPESFTEHWQFQRASQHTVLSLYKVRPHTGLLATYQLSRRLNMISLPTQLTWDELTRKFGYPTH